MQRYSDRLEKVARLLFYLKFCSGEGLGPITTKLLRSTKFTTMIRTLLAVVIARSKNPTPLIMPALMDKGNWHPTERIAKSVISRIIDNELSSSTVRERNEAHAAAADLIENGSIRGSAFRASANRRPGDLEFVVGAHLLLGAFDYSK
jgi:hypothetical protein